MTKFKKTVFGKILKGAAIAGGSLLGLAAIAKVVKNKKGTTALADLKGVPGGLGGTADKLKDHARGLLSGMTKEERALVNAQKDESREAAAKLEVMQKLIRAGASPEVARAKLGIPAEELETFEGEPLKKNILGSFGDNPLMLLLIGGVVLMFILKRK